MKRLVTGLGPLLLLAGLAAARPVSAEISGLLRLNSVLRFDATRAETNNFGPSAPEFHFFREPDANVSGATRPGPEPPAVMLLASGLIALLWRFRPAPR